MLTGINVGLYNEDYSLYKKFYCATSKVWDKVMVTHLLLSIIYHYCKKSHTFDVAQ